MTRLVRWNPVRDMMTMQRTMDRLFDGAFENNTWPRENGARPLALDVYHTDNAYMIEAALPGFSPENVDIAVENRVLTIKANTARETEDKHEGNSHSYLLRERFHGSFQRRLQLPEDVNVEAVAANFEHGMLKITVPKAEEAKPKRVTVNVA